MGWVSGQRGRYRKLMQDFTRKTARKRSLWSLGFRIGVMLEIVTLKWVLYCVIICDPSACITLGEIS